jgi:hypothetical protein
MTTNVLSIKKIYRCDSISSVDDFLSAREVLKLEMFGDDSTDGLRNFRGVLSEIKRLFPEFNVEELIEAFDVEQLKHDEAYRYSFTDEVVRALQKQCGIPKICFNYGIWGCDTPEEVVESYGVNINDVNCYILVNAIKLQDLGCEGQLYGVSEYSEHFEESLMYIKESDEGKKEIVMENIDEMFNRIYEECVCASGASGIANTTPQHMIGCVDQKAGDVSRFTGGNGSKPFNTEVGLNFTNDTMKVHKKKGKKGDAITGTGVVYANGKYMEALKEALDNFDWDKMELSEDYKNSKLNETKRDSNNRIESNHEGSVGDWTDQDSLAFAYDLLDSGKGDLDERAILEELYEAPYFKDLFDEIEKEEELQGGSTSNTVGWDNVASDEIEHAAKEVHKILQDLINRNNSDGF